MSTGRLILVRHGQSEANASGRYVGEGDPGLTATGAGQAKKIAEDVGSVEVDAIFTSPQLRARQTADVIAEACEAEKVHVDDRLVELRLGSFEDTHPSELTPTELGVFHRWRQGRPPAYFEGAETFEEAATRAEDFYLENVADDLKTVVVAHSHILRILLAVCVLEAGAEAHRRLRIDCGQAAVVAWENGTPRLVSLNTSTPSRH